MKSIRAPLYAALLLLTQCNGCKTTDPTPAPPKLPAETTTGARTFGCLVNGQPFTASGINRTNGDWLAPNSLAVRCSYNSNNSVQSIELLMNGKLDNTTFNLVPFDKNINPANNEFVAGYANSTCVYDGKLIKQGSLTLTRYDPVARIAAGRFAFTLYQPGCDTLRVTEGRFDITF